MTLAIIFLKTNCDQSIVLFSNSIRPTEVITAIKYLVHGKCECNICQYSCKKSIYIFFVRQLAYTLVSNCQVQSNILLPSYHRHMSHLPKKKLTLLPYNCQVQGSIFSETSACALNKQMRCIFFTDVTILLLINLYHIALVLNSCIS